MTRGTRRPSVILVCAILCSGGCRHAPATTGPISAPELAQCVASGSAPVIPDVRTPAEYAAGHIPSAINIPHTELAARLAGIVGTKETEVVVHCQAGGRAAAAEKMLAQEGYTNVRDLQGYYGEWAKQGLPVERDKAP